MIDFTKQIENAQAKSKGKIEKALDKLKKTGKKSNLFLRKNEKWVRTKEGGHSVKL